MNIPTEKPIEKVVYLVRHGQSAHNIAPVFQAADAMLSPEGEHQAEVVAERLSQVPFEVLVSSPLPRAHQTAELIAAKTKHEVVFSDLFVERRKPKAVEGKPYTDKEAARIWREWSEDLYIPGLSRDRHDGETYDDLIARTGAALQFLLDRPEAQLAVVTHGYFLRTIMARVLLGDNLNGTLLRRFQELMNVANTGITVLKYKEAFEQPHRWRVWTYNDHSHFAD